jgi:hypothetical protein
MAVELTFRKYNKKAGFLGFRPKQAATINHSGAFDAATY